ncbi:branched-chain amino acid ABC transporter permease [Labrys neptuniae]
MNSLLTSIVAGLSAGGAYAILGVCAVFTYRLVAIVNFTGAAIGAAGTFVMVALFEAGYPLPLDVAAGILAGAGVAMLIGLVMTTWFAGASATTKAAVTAALLVGITALGLRLTGGQHPHNFPELISGSALRLAGVEVTWASVLTLALAVICMLATEALLNRTRVGLQLRALSQRPMAAELIGIRVKLLAVGVWTLMGAISSFALMIIAPLRAPDFLSLSLLVVPGLAAALIGAFTSFRAALVGGILIGVIEGLASGLDAFSQYRGTIPFIVILAVLLWSQRGARWDEAR